jgi:hypothetical protein
MTAPIFKPPSGCRNERIVSVLGQSTARRIKPPTITILRSPLLQSVLHPRLGIAVESRSADLIDVLGEEVICFMQKVENGLRVIEPMTLMTFGLYNEPAGAYLPSVLF